MKKILLILLLGLFLISFASADPFPGCDPDPTFQICTDACDDIFQMAASSIPYYYNSGVCVGNNPEDMDIEHDCFWSSLPEGPCANGWPSSSPDPMACPSFSANGGPVDWTDCNCFWNENGYGTCASIGVGQAQYEAAFDFTHEFFSGNSTCYSMDVEGETYTLQTDIITTGTCFTINNNSVTIDLNGYHILGDNGVLDTGVIINGYDNFTLTDGEINSFGNGIYALNSNNININYMLFNGHQDKAIYFDNVDGGTLDNIECNNNDDDCLFLDYGDSLIINDLTCNANGNALTLQASSDSNVFNDVTITSSVFDAILLIAGSNSNTFNNLEVSGSGDSGIVVNNANSNTFYNLQSYDNDNQDFEYVVGNGNTLLYNNSYGEIDFLNPITSNINGNMTFGSGQNIEIGDNFIYIDSSTLLGLNLPSNVTFRGLPTTHTNYQILKDGVACTTCTNLTALDAGTVIFNTTSWSNFTMYSYNPACELVNIDYDYSTNEAEASTVNQGLNGIKDNTVSMFGNFFSLAPSIGTISAVIILIVILFFLISYVTKIKTNSDTFSG